MSYRDMKSLAFLSSRGGLICILYLTKAQTKFVSTREERHLVAFDCVELYRNLVQVQRRFKFPLIFQVGCQCKAHVKLIDCCYFFFFQAAIVYIKFSAKLIVMQYAFLNAAFSSKLAKCIFHFTVFSFAFCFLFLKDFL